MVPISKPPALAASSVGRLDRYLSESLACPVAKARAGGVEVVAERIRALPSWHGFVVPVLAVAFPEGAVVSARADLVAPLREGLGSDAAQPTLDSAAMLRLGRRLQALMPHAFTLVGDLRAVDSTSFTPGDPRRQADFIPRDDPAAMDLARRFDGAIFGVRGPAGRLVSWAALKLKSDDVWEIAVATDADFRGRGLARDAVTAATRFVLDQGRLCTYVHDESNATSRFVARALGYQRYADLALAEY